MYRRVLVSTDTLTQTRQKMQQLGQQTTTQNKPPVQQNTSFANALAELERPLGDSPTGYQSNQPDKNALFSEAMARAGGNFPASTDKQSAFSQAMQASNAGRDADPFSQALEQQNQQKLIEDEKKRQQKEAVSKKLHDQVNPVDTHELFSARERKVSQDLEATRAEIEALARDIKKLHKEISIASAQIIVTPGDDGAYYVSFLQKLRNFIMLLRQKVKSASSWAQQAQSKKSKKRGKTPGLEINGKQNEQTKTVFDMMHHERSNAYSGS